MGLPWWLSIKNLPANIRNAGATPGPGRSPGGGNGTLLQYSCLKNPLVRGAWGATVHGTAKSQTWLKWLNTAHGKPKGNFCWNHWSCCTKAGSRSSTENYQSDWDKLNIILCGPSFPSGPISDRDYLWMWTAANYRKWWLTHADFFFLLNGISGFLKPGIYSTMTAPHPAPHHIH